MPKQYTSSRRRPAQSRKPNKLTSITAWHDFARNRLIFAFLTLLVAGGLVVYFGSGQSGGTGSRGAVAEHAQDAIVVVNGEPITRMQAENAFENVRQMAR